MRILWLAHRDIEHPLSGGAERSIVEIGSRLVGNGHQVTLVTSGFRGAPSNTNHSGISVRRFPGPLGPHLVTPFLLSKDLPDVVIDDLAHAAPWFSPWFTSVPGTAFFHHLHSRSLPGQVGLPLRAILTIAERSYPALYRGWPFVTESKSAIDDLTRLGIPLSRIRAIPPGVNLGLFSPRNKSKFTQIIYFAGLKPYKRPHLALVLTRRLLSEAVPVRLVLVGGGSMLAGLRRLARSLGIQNDVSFVGRTEDRTLARLVAESWLNVHFSVAEGWGFTIAEATASGTPTVGFAVPGVIDSVVNERTGILTPDGRMDEFTAACVRILRDPEPWYSRCGKLGRSRDWDAVARDWENHLRMVVEESNQNELNGAGRPNGSLRV